ncbi:hypothetical protein B0A48_15958 [Cryoendolithus antarcticus]|uniref:DUF6594 domain-containing protein n=1 Tax=Cryoendolithus antarcticus TaxID=1507870 RepID=A0A1V8SG61_9PEZI|nr:hypothetical protein B0A48_15958 [Cryoendolithus antarcticus]
MQTTSESRDKALSTPSGAATPRDTDGAPKVFVSAEELTDLFNDTERSLRYDGSFVLMKYPVSARAELLLDSVLKQRHIHRYRVRSAKVNATDDDDNEKYEAKPDGKHDQPGPTLQDDNPNTGFSDLMFCPGSDHLLDQAHYIKSWEKHLTKGFGRQKDVHPASAQQHFAVGMDVYLNDQPRNQQGSMWAASYERRIRAASLFDKCRKYGDALSKRDDVAWVHDGKYAPGPMYDVEVGVPAPSGGLKANLARAFCGKRRSPSQNERATPDPEGLARRAVTRIVDKCPNGYARLAAFRCSDHNLMQYRSFSYLYARLLLRLQYNLVELERELDTFDNFDDTAVGGSKRKLYCVSSDDIEQCSDTSANFPFLRTRLQLFEALKIMWVQYDVLLKSKRMALLQQPSDRDWEGARDWIMDNKPLVNRERDFILRKEDIVTLRSGRDGAVFEGLVMRTLHRVNKFLQRRCGCRLVQRIFITPGLKVETANKLDFYYAPNRVSKLVNGIVVVTIFTLLVTPVVVLYRLAGMATEAAPFEGIGLLIVFTMLFGMALSDMTKATRHELFAASAAYCAVLVVFISNFQTQTVSIVNWDEAK